MWEVKDDAVVFVFAQGEAAAAWEAEARGVDVVEDFGAGGGEDGEAI